VNLRQIEWEKGGVLAEKGKRDPCAFGERCVNEKARMYGMEWGQPRGVQCEGKSIKTKSGFSGTENRRKSFFDRFGRGG